MSRVPECSPPGRRPGPVPAAVPRSPRIRSPRGLFSAQGGRRVPRARQRLPSGKQAPRPRDRRQEPDRLLRHHLERCDEPERPLRTVLLAGRRLRAETLEVRPKSAAAFEGRSNRLASLLSLDVGQGYAFARDASPAGPIGLLGAAPHFSAGPLGPEVPSRAPSGERHRRLVA